MKIFGILIALLPAISYADRFEDDLMSTEDPLEEFFCHFEFEEENDSLQHIEPMEVEESHLSSGLCEAIEHAAEEELSTFVEKRAAEINDQYEELLGYSFPLRNEVPEYSPTVEKVPEQRKHLLSSRPKVVQDSKVSQKDYLEE